MNSLSKKYQEPFTAKVKEIIGMIAILINYVITDIQKKSRGFKIGIFSIFLVVTFLVVLQSALSLIPNIFLRLAENEAGQTDFTLTAVSAANDTRLAQTSSSSSNSSLSSTIYRALNVTDIEEKLYGVQEIAGITPRWMLPVKVGNPSTPDVTFNVIAIVLDSERERKLGFGSNIDLPDLKEMQCWISESTSRLAGLTGDKIHFTVNFMETMNSLQAISTSGTTDSSDANATARALATTFLDTYLTSMGAVRDPSNPEIYTYGNDTSGGLIKVNFTNNALPDLSGIIWAPGTYPNFTVEFNTSAMVDAMIPWINNGSTIDTNYTVTATVDSPNGKWPKSLGNVIVIDSKYIVKQIEENMILALDNANLSQRTGNPIIDSRIPNNTNKTEIEIEIRKYFDAFKIEQFALTANILLKNRGKIYHSQNSVQPNLIIASNKIFSRLGRDYPATISSPLSTALDAFFLFKNFLDNIFNSTVFILILLSALLIYSLMNSNVEEKTYEFGMLRALGLEKMNLTILLTIQSMFFAIPGLVLGLLFAFTINFMVTYYISNFVTMSNRYAPADSALALGICIAILVPLASNIIPIRKALSKTLRDSLNVYHRTISDINVRIMKLAEIGISPAQTIGSITMIVMGFITYYLAPYAFIFQNLPMFFIILNIVMMMMVIGFTMLLNLLQPFLERLLLKMMILPLPSERPLQSVVLKNFDSHRPRNNKTSLMFSIALAFLIFSGTGFRLNSDIIAQQLMSTYGSDVVVTAVGSVYLDEQALRESLEDFKVRFPSIIQDYAFVSEDFNDQPQIPTVKFASLAGTPSQKVTITSVDRSYLNSVFEDLYVPNEVDLTVTPKSMLKGKHADIVDSLYTQQGLETNLSFDKLQVLTNAAPRSNVDFNAYFGLTEARFLIPKGLSLQASVDPETSALVQLYPYANFRGRVRGVATKVPGFFFTGYKTYSKYTVLTSHEDYASMRAKVYGNLDSGSTGYTQAQAYLDEIPEGSSYGVAKQGLLLRLQSGVSERDRQQLVNTIETLLNNQFILVSDVIGTVTTLKDTLVFIDIFFILVALIAISLSFFFIVISFGNNISENSWEFGVLRAIGLNKKQMTTIYVLEALCLVLAAAILGTAVGIAVAIISNNLFFMFTELPFTLDFPLLVFLLTLGTSLITAVLGSKIAVDDVKNKQISSIIKSLD